MKISWTSVCVHEDILDFNMCSWRYLSCCFGWCLEIYFQGFPWEHAFIQPMSFRLKCQAQFGKDKGVNGLAFTVETLKNNGLLWKLSSSTDLIKEGFPMQYPPPSGRNCWVGHLCVISLFTTILILFFDAQAESTIDSTWAFLLVGIYMFMGLCQWSIFQLSENCFLID